MAIDTTRHPCFNDQARHRFARVHLPVAPRCNIQCNFCDRQHDCVNESRPGVTSRILTPRQALWATRRLVEQLPEVSVIGIAGPGDPFANPRETLETLRLVRAAYSEMILCVATNGLGIAPHVEEVARLNVSHITITINAVDSAIASKIYRWVRDGKFVRRGRDAAEILLARQAEAVRRLKEAGVMVKINTIAIPGVNVHHISEVARRVAEWGADVLNVIPLIPVSGTPFESFDPPSADEMVKIRQQAREYLPQMQHCARCRADAAGLLGQAQGPSIHEIFDQAASQADDDRKRPYVAVASWEGALVNQHLGECQTLFIYERRDRQYELVETRPMPRPGCGDQRWHDLEQILHDCRAVVAAAIGSRPRTVLAASPLRLLEAEGLVQDALEAIYEGKPLRPVLSMSTCGRDCAASSECGGGVGCG
jgi:nitrogen fixation protein NifB